MSQSLDQAQSYSQRWIDIVHKPSLSQEEGKQIIEESKTNFADYFNKGWLEYRKSVTEAGDWAATEWTGSGAIFCDVLGREYIDCLGGYGLLDLGWAHPEVVDNCARPTQPHAHAQPGIDRPAARRAGSADGPHHTGRHQYSFFCASGTEAVEGAIKVAKLYTRKSGFIVAVKAFHGKTMGSSEHDGQG